MKINIHTKTERIIGCVRVGEATFLKIQSMAKKRKVSNQTVIRAILDQVIESIED